MRYISTRCGEGRTTHKSVSASAAILQGLAEDGGLYVPESIPGLPLPLEKLLALPYPELAKAILAPFLNFSDEQLSRCTTAAYAPQRFASPAIAPVVSPFSPFLPANTHFLELFHGPTLAFKDMALSILPHLLKTSAEIEGQSDKIVILTATSGDTGKAALEAFCDVDGVSIVVFYPQDGVSTLQKRQMITQEGQNTAVIGVAGNFDDAQTGVKALFSDEALRQKLKQAGKVFSSANSINIGRLLPQIAYYFYAYGQLVQKGAVPMGEAVNFVVPTGNFGNILAGYYAKQMGLPLHKLVCASNDNNVLYDFFRTGVYDKNRPFHCTISPSMDILVSSNLERLLYHATGPEAVRGMMRGLNTHGRFEAKADFADFHAAFVTQDGARRAIAACAASGYVMDPHTAVAYAAGQQYTAETGDARAQVVIATASPFKFAADVLAAMGHAAAFDEADFMAPVTLLSEKSGLPIPGPAAALAHKPVLHTRVCAVSDMKAALEAVL